MLSKALDYLQAASVTAAVLFLLWSVAEFVSRVGAGVEAYKERTKMLAAQFAEARRVQDRIERLQSERPRPFAEAFDLQGEIRRKAEADAARIQRGTEPRPR